MHYFRPRESIFHDGKIKFFEVEKCSKFQILENQLGIDLKSSAPVELSFFDEKETLKHVNFKKKIQLFENFDFQLIMFF